MVFYSRYYIHEMLLVFFTVVALVGGWRYWRSRKIGWALLAGAAVGLMHATKETFIITIAAAALALVVNQIWNRLLDASGSPLKAKSINWKHVAAGFGVWLIVAFVLFSSFFKHPGGLLDSIKTYEPWLHRAGGESPHIHSWHFYLHRLLFFHSANGPVWSEALILVLAIIGTCAGFARKGLTDADASFVRFLALYTAALTAAYSLIAYKTPWCLLSFWHGMIVLAGVGAGVLIHVSRLQWAKAAMNCFLLIGAAQLAGQGWRASTEYSADRRNPYVYAQTSADILKLIDKVEALSQASPHGKQILIKVMARESEYWPLPWYLRSFKQVGWWGELPVDPFAPLMIVSSKFQAGLDQKKTHLMTGYFELRPGEFFELYVELDLWRKYLQKNPPATEN